MVKILKATTNDIPIIRNLAEETWWPTYSSIISVEQIRYMLDHIYSEQELNRVITTGAQNFVILYDDDGPQGFASFGFRSDDNQVWKLHKLYILPDNHGKGYGRILIDEIKKQAKAIGISTLDLNVNRHNSAKSFYEKIGFQVIREEDVPIGPYWMNDYVMRLNF